MMGSSNILRYALWLQAIGVTLASGATRFLPESGGLHYNDYINPLPTRYNLSDSQSLYLGEYSNSHWSSSFVLGSDGHEYLILSHVLASTLAGVYRGSILDITDPSYYQRFSTLYNTSGLYTDNKTDFNYTFDNFHMGIAGSDPLGSIETWSTHENVTFNFTYELSSPVLLNAGAGTFQWEIPTIVNEWSMPAGKMSGTLEKEGTTIEVDPTKSFTWYDRQWQTSPAASNWTWFELHVQRGVQSCEGEKMSIWFFPSGYDSTTKGFATIREQPGIQTVVPATLQHGNKTWQSPSGNLYSLEWTIDLLDGTTLHINTTRDDQELADDMRLFVTYEGYVDVTGVTRSGESVRGYGLAEIQPVASM